MLNKKIFIKNNSSPLTPIPTKMRPKNTLKNKIKAIFFDIYGTLFISASGDISLAQKNSAENLKISQLLKKYQIKKNITELLKEFFQAIKSKHKILKKQGIDYPEIIIEEIWMQVLNVKDKEKAKDFSLEYELIVNPIYPFPHLKKILKTFQKNLIPLGIISNAQFFTPLLFPAFLGQNLKELGFLEEFLFFSYEHQQAKPSLFLFEKAKTALKKQHISPQNTLYLGNDMLNDIYPARTIGFQTALFAGDKRSLRLRKNNQICNHISPELIITELNQLLEFTI